MRLFRRLLLLSLPTLFSSLVWAAPQQMGDENLNVGVRELARRVITAVLPSSQELELMADSENLSSLPSSEFRQAIRVFGEEMQSRGVRISTVVRPSGTAVRIFLSENAQEYLWVGQILREGGNQVVITTVPRASVTAKSPAKPVMLLQKQLILSEPDAILDLLFYKFPESGDQRVLVLEPEQVRVFRADQTGWTVEASIALHHDSAWPRDLRARLLQVSEGVTAFYPDAECHLSFRNLWTASCEAKSSSFPVFSSHEFVQMAQFEPRRNFFRSSPGEEEARTGIVPAYAVAYLGMRVGETYTVATHLDGRAVLYQKSGESVGEMPGWGSDIVAQSTTCGRQSQVLVTRTGDWTEPDAIQGFEIIDRQPEAVSPVADFPGPVTALWAAEGGDSAIAVIRNLKTGVYEAYSLSLTCSH